MRIILIVTLALSLVQAQSIDQLIHYAIKKHPSLKSIKYRLASMDARIAKSQKWDNPDLSFTVNDIQFRKPLGRSEERMQYQAVSFRQKFPWFGKLEARKKVAKEEKSVMFHSLASAQVELAYKIRVTSYTIKELEARIEIVKKYTHLAKQNIALFTQYMATDTMSHSDSVNAELSLSNIEIRAQRYSAILKSQKEKLAYLVQKRVKKISNRLKIKKPKSLRYYLAKLKKNPKYHMKLAKYDVARAEKNLIDMEKDPDPYVKAGYFNRPDYPDYATVSVGVSLPLYGTEALDSEIAQAKALASQSESIDYKSFLESEIRLNYVKLTEAYHIYSIIQHKSLPQLNHLLELSSSAIEEGASLLTYTNTLEQKLALEEERISSMAEFMRTEAKLDALTGVK